jgi:hypothetical protein
VSALGGPLSSAALWRGVGKQLATPAAAATIVATAGLWEGGVTGEVTRSLQAKLRDEFSVKGLGALGDGTGALLSSVYATQAAAKAVYPNTTVFSGTSRGAADSTHIDLPWDADLTLYDFTSGAWAVNISAGTGSGQTSTITAQATTTVITTTWAAIGASGTVTFTLTSATGVQVGDVIETTINGIRQVRRVATINTGTGVGTVHSAWSFTTSGVGVAVTVERWVATVSPAWSVTPDGTSTINVQRQVVLTDTLDWAAWQAAINRAYAASQVSQGAGTGTAMALTVRIDAPAGMYVLNDRLWLPQIPGLYVRGAGRLATWLRQQTDNTPIFQFGGLFSHSQRFEGLGFDWTNNQPSTNTAANAFHVPSKTLGAGNDPAVYNSKFADLWMDKGYYLFWSTSKSACWGNRFDYAWLQSNMSGGLIRTTSTPNAGGPNNSFDHIYVSGNTMAGPIWDMNGYWGHIGCVELNDLNQSPVILSDTGVGKWFIGHLMVERWIYSVANRIIFNCNNAHLVIGMLRFYGNPATISATTFMMQATHAEIGYFDTNIVTKSATLYLWAGASGSTCRIHKLGPSFDTTDSHYVLCQGTQNAVSGLTVDNFQDGRSRQNSDADLTLTVRDSTNQYWATIGTHNITLPTEALSSTSNMFAGKRFVLYFAAVTGTVTIKNGEGSTLATKTTAGTVTIIWTADGGSGKYLVMS